MTSPEITPELVRKHNLSPDEFEKVKGILGREPSYTELGIFSVMWSEHCSYKNSRPLLKGFPTKSPKILVGAGEENAGIIDIGDGLAIAFKIESHNHPSAVEPFQGAATGVGGIIRDIFTMGARPVCAVNSLRFGPITEDGPPRTSPLPSTGGVGEPVGDGGRERTNPAAAAVGNHPLPGGEGRGEDEPSFAEGARVEPVGSPGRRRSDSLSTAMEDLPLAEGEGRGEGEPSFAEGAHLPTTNR